MTVDSRQLAVAADGDCRPLSTAYCPLTITKPLSRNFTRGTLSMPRMLIFGLVVSMILSSGVRAEEASQGKPADGGVSTPNAAQPDASNAPDPGPNSAGAAFADFDN